MNGEEEEIVGWRKKPTKQKIGKGGAECNAIEKERWGIRSEASTTASLPPLVPFFHLLIYIPQLLVLLISFRWILITAITAQYSSHVLWNHSLSLSFSRFSHCPLLSLFISFSAAILSRSYYSENMIPLWFVLDRKWSLISSPSVILGDINPVMALCSIYFFTRVLSLLGVQEVH